MAGERTRQGLGEAEKDREAERQRESQRETAGA